MENSGNICLVIFPLLLKEEGLREVSGEKVPKDSTETTLASRWSLKAV